MTAPEEKQNDLIHVKADFKSPCLVDLSIKAFPSCIAQAKKNALKILSKEASFPGFRKGKAPEELVLKNYSHLLQSQWEKSLADLAFEESYKLFPVRPLNNRVPIHYHLQKFLPEEFAELSFNYEIEPSPPSIDPRQFVLEPLTLPPVGEKEIQEMIRQILLFHAKWEEVFRPIQEGDFILVDLESLEGSPSEKVLKETRFEVTDASMAHWMKKLVLGTSKGDVLEGISEPDASLPEEKKREFSPQKVRLTIKKIEIANLPELTDDFLQSIKAPPLKEFPKHIETILLDMQDKKKEEFHEEQVYRFLLQYATFDLPESIVRLEKEKRFNLLFNENPSLAQAWKTLSAEEKEKIEKPILQKAKDAISLFYLCRKFLEENQYSLPPTLVEKIAGMLRKEGYSPEDAAALASSQLILISARKMLIQFAQEKTLESSKQSE